MQQRSPLIANYHGRLPSLVLKHCVNALWAASQRVGSSLEAPTGLTRLTILLLLVCLGHPQGAVGYIRTARS
jgi:hypothetical protein